MNPSFLRALIGLAAISVLLFWGVFLGQPIALEAFFGKAYHLAMALVSCLSFVGVCLAYPKGEALFGKRTMNWVLLGGVAMAIMLYIAAPRSVAHPDLLSMIVGLLVIGVVMGVMTLGVAYSLRLEIPESR